VSDPSPEPAPHHAGLGRVTLRPVRPEDRDFLLALYASTREAELAVTGWGPEQKRAFLTMQFEAQHSHYHKHFGQAAFDVVEIAGEPVGRLYVDRDRDEIRVLDIALLSNYRGQGVGSRLLADLLEEARRDGKRVVIHVDQHNPAMRLYVRLGFEPVADEGVYLKMAWSARERQAKTAS
jgi:ribosomal protein S18 acetylase RimI-like enzyme